MLTRSPLMTFNHMRYYWLIKLIDDNALISVTTTHNSYTLQAPYTLHKTSSSPHLRDVRSLLSVMFTEACVVCRSCCILAVSSIQIFNDPYICINFIILSTVYRLFYKFKYSMPESN